MVMMNMQTNKPTLHPLRFCAVILLLAVLLSAGCAAPELSAEARSVTVFAMDTVMDLTVYGGDDDLLTEAENMIHFLETEFSVTDPESDLSRLNAAGDFSVGPDTKSLLASALALSDRTDGAFDCTIYPVLRAWGFTSGEYRVPAEDELAALLPLVNWRKVTVSGERVTVGEGQMLDFGAIAKGYTGDRLISLFREAGAASALVNLGGNVQLLGKKPDGSLWNVAVADPFGNGYAGVLKTADCAVITSGGYERYFEEDGKIYRHILDPKTGIPADNGLSSVTVVGERGIVCDALSTALYVMGAERAEAFWRGSDDFEIILLTEDGQIILSEGLEDSFAPSGEWRDAPITVIRDD